VGILPELFYRARLVEANYSDLRKRAGDIERARRGELFVPNRRADVEKESFPVKTNDSGETTIAACISQEKDVVV
jgi:hypothetical protein